MQTPSESLTHARESFDKAFFAPLDKLKNRYEATKPEFKKPDTSILFRPLDILKEKVIKNSAPTLVTYNDDEFINAESALGRTIFGPIPVGHQREFFREKKNIWIWHESWTEGDAKKSITVRYEVRKDGVYKKPTGGSYTRISGDELENFRRALHRYLDLIKTQLY